MYSHNCYSAQGVLAHAAGHCSLVSLLTVFISLHHNAKRVMLIDIQGFSNGIMNLAQLWLFSFSKIIQPLGNHMSLFSSSWKRIKDSYTCTPAIFVNQIIQRQ